MNPLRLGLYALAFLWTLLITALIGNVIQDAYGGTPSGVNYAMFAAVFSWIVLIVGIVASFIESIPAIALIVLDALAALFTFVAGVELAAKLGVHSCTNLDYTRQNELTAGSADLQKRCSELQASTAFFWFLFATYCGVLVLNALSAGGSGMSRGGGIRKGLGV